MKKESYIKKQKRRSNAPKLKTLKKLNAAKKEQERESNRIRTHEGISYERYCIAKFLSMLTREKISKLIKLNLISRRVGKRKGYFIDFPLIAEILMQEFKGTGYDFGSLDVKHFKKALKSIDWDSHFEELRKDGSI